MSRAKPAPIPAGILKLFLRMGSSAGTGHAGYASRYAIENYRIFF